MANLMKFNWDTGKLDFVVDPAAPGISHAALDDLIAPADDHTQYALADKSRPTPWVSAADLSVRSLADLGTKNHSDLDLLIAPADDHTQYLLLAGRAGGQTAYGGTAAGDILSLFGSSDSDQGLINVSSPINSLADYSLIPTNYLFQWAGTVPSSGSAVLGMIRSAPVEVAIDNSTFIYAGFLEQGNYYQDVAAGFAVQTLFLAQPRYRTRTIGIAPPQAFTLAAQPIFQNDGIGATPAIPNMIGMSVSPTLMTTVSGDTLTLTNLIGVNLAPIWSTVGGTTVNFGTIIGLKLNAPVKGIFFPGSGVETMNAYYGVDFPAMAFAGNVPKYVIRSNLAPATNARFLMNEGNAMSDHGAGHIYFDDNAGIAYGQVGAYAFDVWTRWNAARSAYATFFPATNSDLDLSSPSADRFLWNGSGGSTTGEFNFNCAKFSLGAQTGAVGNQVGVFAAPTRSVGVPGGWADFILTQAGSLSIGSFAMSDVSAWVINSISLAAHTGTISDIATFRVGGMTTSLIGGALTSALNITGRHTQKGVHNYPEVTRTIGADQNNYSPATGNSMREVIRLEATGANRTVTGIAIQQTGDTYFIINNGATYNVTLAHQNASSTTSNRFISPTGADLVLGPDEYAFVWHDPVTDRWRILDTNGA